MKRVDFYHLQRWPLEQALPPLLSKVLESGQRAVVLTASRERAEALSAVLWTWKPDSWLPHGTPSDGFDAEQPCGWRKRMNVPMGRRSSFSPME